MFNWFKKERTPSGFNQKETKMKAVIETTKTGRFAVNSGGQVVGTYARKRDAVRGAQRRGFTVIPA